MTILDLIETSTTNAHDKGFDVTQHETQLLLIASEVAEALEHVEPGSNATIDDLRSIFTLSMTALEDYRKNATDYNDTSDIPCAQDRALFVEELADIIIRVCSYAGGNGMGLSLEAKLEEKTHKNKNRPYLHGKGF